jgi:hypothetical protein
LPEATSYTWRFPNGEIYEGPVLLLTHSVACSYTVELEVKLPDGSTSLAWSQISIAGDDLLKFDSSTGYFQLQEFGISNRLDGSNLASVSSPSGSMHIDLGSLDEPIRIPKDLIDRIFGADSFSLSFTLQANAIGSSGELFRLHSSLLAEVTPLGEFRFTINTSANESVVLVSRGTNLSDGELHEVTIRLDGPTDRIEVSVDGSTLASSTVEGSTKSIGYWDFTFGSPWGGTTFDGKIMSFDLNVTQNDYPILVSNPETDYTHYSSEGGYSETSSLPLEEKTEEFLAPRIADFDFDSSDIGGNFRLFGDAYIDSNSNDGFVVLDGYNDFIRLGALSELKIDNRFSINMSFSASSASDRSETLLSNGNYFSIILDGDSISCVFKNSSERSSDLVFRANDVAIRDAQFHEISVVADSAENRFQLAIDGHVLVDSFEESLPIQGWNSERSWWAQGWQIGDGGRRSSDFEGSISYFELSEDAMFMNI